MDERLIVLVAEDDTAYVFSPDKKDQAAIQETVIIGANLDVERYRVTDEQWRRARAACPDIEVIDMREATA